MTRTWTASITIREARQAAVEIAATDSQHDLLADQVQAALRDATELFTDATVDCTITVWKTTKARGTERDRTYSVYRDRSGRVVAQR